MTLLDLFIVGNVGVYECEVCDGCSVRVECLEVALADPELVGLLGGTTKRERRSKRRAVA